MFTDLTTNPFETATRRRFTGMDVTLRAHAERCAQMAAHHAGDNGLAVISARATAALGSWKTAFNRWQHSRSSQKGKTRQLNALLVDLRGRQIGKWQVMVQNTGLDDGKWLKGTPAFEDLFPRGRRPFQQGSLAARAAAVESLAAALGRNPELAAVATAVRKFHASLQTALEGREAGGESPRNCARTLETQRKAAALVLYKNMARLMEKYAESPGTILQFFDLSEMKKPRRRDSPRRPGASPPDE